MRNTIITVTVLLALAVTPATAQDRVSKEEGVGVGVGATIGAVAGGPVGLLIGAAVGAKLGDTFFAKDKNGFTLVLSGDVPLITDETLQELFDLHEAQGNTATVVTASVSS